jgi:hypothetical protein
MNSNQRERNSNKKKKTKECFNFYVIAEFGKVLLRLARTDLISDIFLYGM